MQNDHLTHELRVAEFNRNLVIAEEQTDERNTNIRSLKKYVAETTE